MLDIASKSALSPRKVQAHAQACTRRRQATGRSRAASTQLGPGGVPQKHCNCKNSRCLKLYCECFASGRYCDHCNCLNCCNNRDHEAVRQQAVESILERNPNAFRPKIQGSVRLPCEARTGVAQLVGL